MSEDSILPILRAHRLLIATGASLFVAGLLTRGFLIRTKPTSVIRSPRETLLPQLSAAEKSKLPYPPDALPGARDVESPYGTIRVYEWGPAEGQKVLLVHGVSTPCLALGGVAHGLVDRGCRVMLFDLFGRGYSDTPTGLPQDIRLFASQILIALASSPLSWVGGGNRFSLVGYSLGGGISAAFTSYFPALVESLVLIAPSGLIRPHHFSRLNRIIYSEGVIPETILNRTVKKRLQKPLYPTKQAQEEPGDNDVLAPVQGEINLEANPATVLSKSHPDITIEAAVNHQVLNHDGFVVAFMSSIRHGPISEQHNDWRRIGTCLAEQNHGDKTTEALGMTKGKVLIISGSNDAIIKKEELREDATEVFEGNVIFQFIEAGHEAPISQAGRVANLIWDFWN